MADRKALSPQITVQNKDATGQTVDQIVKVGPLSFGAVKELIDQIAIVNLPLPNLAGGAISSWLESSQQGVAALDPSDSPEILAAKVALSQQHSNLGLYRVIADLLSENLQVLYQWLLKHPPIAAALAKGATGLTDEQLDSLTASQFIRVLRAAWNALVEDGFQEELAGFFGDLLPLSRQGEAGSQNSAESSAPANTQDSSSASKSESPASPAGG